ncbi:peptidase C14, caspase catalytic subunit p20 [Magnetococcus marinus MC-1]|uniref:Peptidase C14, caspase catalytic subunit p20 n=1 Tax=Magnetococcus marinus (strain ATCC BAA-1437 / JCM 17883 / MC-1) TaxID=156889 RepID=A0LDB9_MAGMM|nr:caspase family protein [Magnetococcus marinus]ABK45962.1 peptidase C14, caspase catalytic subunit p20 [Magnetococcus marinus MC-1]
MARRSPYRNSLLWLLGITVLCMTLPNQAEARRAHTRVQGLKSIQRAVNTQARTLFHPKMRIRSRYAAPMTTLAKESTEQWLASATNTGAIQLWNLKNGKRELELNGHEQRVSTLYFVPAYVGITETDAKVRIRSALQRPNYLISGDVQGQMILWNLQTEQIVRRFYHNPQPVLAVSVDKRGVLMSLQKHDLLRMWNVQNGQASDQLEHGINQATAATFDEEGKLFVVGNAHGDVAAWRVKAPQKRVALLQGDGKPVRSMALSPDEVTVAIGDDQGGIRLFKTGDVKTVLEVDKHRGAITSLRFNNKGTELISAAADKQIHLWQLPNNAGGFRPPSTESGSGNSTRALLKHSYTAHTESVNDVTTLNEGKMLISAGEDVMLRLWDKDQGKEMLRLVSMRKGWAGVSPEGFFDGVLEGNAEERLDAIEWGDDDTQFKLDGFLEHYYQPALLGKLMAGRPLIVNKPDLPKIEQGFYLPPKVNFLSPTASSAVEGEGEVVIEVVEQGGGMQELRLYHNGKVVEPSKQRVLETSDEEASETLTKYAYTIPWLPGFNTLRAVALSNDGIESLPAELQVVARDEADQHRNIHMLAVGINQYALDALTLNFGVADAKGVNTFFRRQDYVHYSNLVSHQLYDAAATRAAIRALLREKLATIPPQDTVLIFFAGHGEVVDDRWYFIPHELSEVSAEQIQQQGFSSSQIYEDLSTIPARHIVMFIDACHSGAAADAFAHYDAQRPIARLSRSTGIHIATSTSVTQLANELRELGHGVFTHTLLEGLKGKADRAPKDGRIMVQEILHYVRDQVPEFSEKLELEEEQTPVINSRGEDFIILGH